MKPFSQNRHQRVKIFNHPFIPPVQKMKNLIIALFAFLFLLPSCDDGFGLFDSKRIAGKGLLEKQDRDVKDFKGIDLMASANVIIKQSPTYKVVVEGQNNILEVLETVVDNGILRIKFKDGSWSLNFDKLNVYIETPSVSSLEISGSGDMTLETAFNADDLDIKLSGSGNIKTVDGLTAKKIDAEIGGSGDIKMGMTTASELKATILGSGNFTIKGTAEKAKLQVTGSGDIDADDFVTKATEAQTTGSGNIHCHATESLDAQIMGSGDIRYSGNPPSVKSKAMGSGEIKTK